MAEELSLAHYFEYWADVKNRLLLAAKLDPPQEDKPDIYRKPSRLIFGASIHRYRCVPMREFDIRNFERRNGISLPLNFRTYLLVFGDNSGGPGNGIYNGRQLFKYSEALSQNLKKPCPLKPRGGIGFQVSDESSGDDSSELDASSLHSVATDTPDDEDDDSEYSFLQGDVKCGTLTIGDSGNPTIHALVVNGPTRGDVFSYTGDMLFYEGSFEKWYVKWLEETLSDLQSGEAKRHFEKTYQHRNG